MGHSYFTKKNLHKMNDNQNQSTTTNTETKTKSTSEQLGEAATQIGNQIEKDLETLRKADTLSFSEAAKRELASADKSFKQMSQDVQREVNKAQAQTQANNGCGKESCPCKDDCKCDKQSKKC